jgi:subtilase family serine protease
MADAAADTGAGDATADAAPDVLVPPQLSVKLTAEPASGNAPLLVTFHAELAGAPTEAVFFSWDFGDGDVLKSGTDTESHNFLEKGGYNVKVRASWKPKTSVKAEAQITVNVSNPASLLFTTSPSVTIASPETVGPGSDVTLSFAIGNEGDSVDQPFEIGLYMSATDVLDNTALPLGVITVPAFDSGKVLDFTYKPGAPPEALAVGKVPQVADGAYFVLVQIDTKQTVNEFNRLDNFAVATSQLTVDTKAASKPDFAMTAPTFPAKSYSPGDLLNVNLSLSNVGKGQAKKVVYGLFLSKDQKLDYDFSKKPICDEKGVCQDDPSQIDKLLTESATTTWLNAGPGAVLPVQTGVVVPELADGSYYLLGKVDMQELVEEDSESNNLVVAAEPVQVAKTTLEGVDLALQAMTVKPKGVALNDSVNVLWTVKNVGTKPSPDKFPAGIYFCPNSNFSKTNCIINQTNFTLPALAAGQELAGATKVTIDKNTPISKTWYVYLQLDPAASVVELDKSNNVKSFGTLEVAASSSVDLSPSEVVFHPATIAAGGTLKLGYTVNNTGITGSGAATTWYALTTTGACSAAAVAAGTAVLIKKVPFDGAEPGEQLDVADSVQIPVGLQNGVSDYKLCVVLDAEKNIAKEKNPGNNAALSADALVVTGAKGGCFEDAADKGGANNDSATKAVALPETATASFGSCGNDDWWLVPAQKGDTLVATLTATPALWTTPVPSELDLEIYAPDGKTLLDTNKIPGTPKKATALTLPQTGNYLVRVLPHVPGAQAQYTLKTQVIGPPIKPDLLAASLTVAPQATYPGALVKAKLKLSNLGSQAAGPFVVRFVLSADPTLSGEDATLKTVTFDKGLAGGQTQLLDQPLVLPTVKGGKWFVGAVADVNAQVAEADEGNNTLFAPAISLSTELACATDNYSGNHTLADAAALPSTSASYAKLNVCPGLEDWFAIEVPQGKAFSAKVSYAYSKGKGLVGVQVVDPSKTAIVAGAANANVSTAVLPYVQTGGTYYVHTYVLPESTPPGPYDYELTVTVAEPDPTDVCLADYFEPNNSPEAGPSLGCGLSTLSLCLGDEDWFHLDMKKDEVVTIDFQNAPGAFQLKVYGDPKVAPLKSLSGNGSLQFTAPVDGTYQMQASYKSPGTKPGAFAYSIKVDGGKGTDLLAKLVSVTPGSQVQGEDLEINAQLQNICQDPAQAFEYAYYLSTDDKLDPSDVLLNQKQVKGLGGKATVDIKADKATVPKNYKPGPAYLLLAADSANAVAESQEQNNADATKVSVTLLCLPDAFWPNVAPTIAANLPEGKTKDLSLCPYEFDWFKFEAVKGETLTLTMDFAQALGDLDLRLYKAGKFDAPVATSQTKAAPEQLVWTADATGTYYVRINGFQGESNTYSLSLCKKIGGSCVECKNDSMCAIDQSCDPTTTLCGAKICQNASVCDDGNQCTADTCGVTGKCQNVPGPLACSDGDGCTLGETCDGTGACKLPLGATVTSVATSGVPGQDLGLDATGTVDGGVVVVGARDSGKGLQGWVERRSASGNLKWSMTLSEGPAPAQLEAVQVVGNELWAVGWASVAGTAGWFVRLDLDTGKVLSSKLALPGGKSAQLHGLAGNALVGSAVGPDGSQDAWLVRVQADGSLGGDLLVGGDGADAFWQVALAADGKTAIAVGSDVDAQGTEHALVVQAGATVAWQTTLPGPEQTRARAVVLTSNGGIVAAGGSDVGQTGATPPAMQSALWWLEPSTGKVSKTVVVPAATLQAPAFAGQKSSQILSLWSAPSGSLLAVGWAGATAEPTFGIDGAVWALDAQGVVKSTSAVGKAGKDLLSTLLAKGGQAWLFGTAGEAAAADALQALWSPIALDCDDGNPATADSCDAVKGCQHTPL